MLSCAEVSEQLTAVVDEPTDAAPGVVAHIESCLSCQAQLAKGRRLLRLLHGLKSEDLPLPQNALSEILVAVSKAGRERAIRSAIAGRKVAYAGALGLGLLAGGVVVLVARTHIGGARKVGQSPT